ncbi:DapH/DapD/GlmU-related protein [Lacinutrix sp. Bg11-31]|uniref:DapH/DapD/GlmU-related protein n=1 Tax=Lacinutrix sp. Bg11-31 TaxID=2057808 RepID=UPI000C304150|nr:DapH/DapD/GlmU-related protein [Lacinutrix sp. Bg11-31]AUC80642.1 acetyltransferase [Lacinutrix sp. Bg11-31]
MNKKEIYLIGVGNYTEVIIELAIDCGYTVNGLYHYNNERIGEEVLGIAIIGCTEDLFKTDIKGKQFALTMGENKLRSEMASKIKSLGGFTPNLIHPTALISKSATIGYGCFIHFNAVIWTKSILGNDCVVSPNAMIAHHSEIADACSVASFSVIGAYCKVGKRVLFGVNSIVLPKALIIGDDCIVGAKANVTKSYPNNCLLVGNPARKIKDLN